MPTMPNVIGLEYPDALTSLVSSGVRVLPLGYFQVDPVILAWKPSNTVLPGFVVSQSPSNGSAIAANAAVNLTVSNYPISVAYP